VQLVHGPGWDPARPIRQQDGWDGHAAFMDGLVDDGFIILGGPVGEGNPPEETLHAVEAADEDEIRTRLAGIRGPGQGRCESGRSSPGRCGSTAAPARQVAHLISRADQLPQAHLPLTGSGDQAQ
jgi:hypothetical protein